MHHFFPLVSGSVLCQYGSGTAGSSDGRERSAQFHTPQGMVYLDEALYVADTENHLIRKVQPRVRLKYMYVQLRQVGGCGL